jgi:hypothetical protein
MRDELMTKSDEQIVRECLENEFYGPARRERLAAFDRIIARCVPEFPEGWTAKEISPDFDGWICWIQQWNGYILIDQLQGRGETIREACESAIKKIGEQKE